MKILFKSMILFFSTMLLLLGGLQDSHAEAKKMSLNKKQITLTQGKKYQLKVKNINSRLKKKVKWSSNKKKVATVSKKGKITAKKAGVARITAKAESRKVSCKVTVKAKKRNTKKETEEESNDDEAILQGIVDQQIALGITSLSEDLLEDTDHYTWKNGRLTAIKWSGCELVGSISFAGLSALKKINCQRNQLTNLDFDGCSSLSTVRCDKGVCIENYDGDIDYSTRMVFNPEDIAAINKIVDEQKALGISDKVFNKIYINETYQDDYQWDDYSDEVLIYEWSEENGKLTSINWAKYNLKGSISFANLLSLSQIDCQYNQLTDLDFDGCSNLSKVYCDGGVCIKNYNGEIHRSERVLLNQEDVAAINKIADEQKALGVSSTVLDQIYLNKTYSNSDSSIFVWNTENGKLKELHFDKIDYNGGITYGLHGNISFSELTAVEGIFLGNSCKFTEIDVSGCSLLSTLDCRYNLLTSLDTSSCTHLENLYCSNNYLSVLTICQSPLLSLSCWGNQLTDLDLSECSSLQTLDCTDNQITELKVAGCPALQELYCYNNPLETLDISDCTSLTKAGLIKVDYLEEEDDYRYWENGIIWNESNYYGWKDLSTFDVDQFKLWFSKNFYDNDPSSDSLPLHSLDASGCTSLTGLDCSLAQITSLDVSGCTSLQELFCVGGQLSSLNVTDCPSLQTLDCHSNQLTDLNLENCSSLLFLDCYDNQIQQLDVTECLDLQKLICSFNQLTDLNVASMPALNLLVCNNNQITTLDISGCYSLNDLVCCGNLLEQLDITDCPSLRGVTCSCNNLTSLDASANQLLQYLFCADNQLTDLNVANCFSLYSLYCCNNQLTEIDISLCPDGLYIQYDPDTELIE